MITHILVDVHGVLTKGDEGQKFSLTLKNNFNIDPQEQTTFWRSYVDKLDKNQISVEKYIKFFNKKFNVSLTPDEYYNLIVKNITPNLKLLKHISKLSNKYHIIIVSDNLLDLANKLANTFQNNFDKYLKFYSYKYGLTKKDGLLSAVIDNLNVNPKNCLFIDDNKRNIDVGKQLGINSILFKNNQDLFAQIEKFLN